MQMTQLFLVIEKWGQKGFFAEMFYPTHLCYKSVPPVPSTQVSQTQFTRWPLKVESG